MRIRATLGLVLGLYLPSCGFYHEEKGGGPDNSRFGKAQADFAIVQSAIFGPRCISCHQQYSTHRGVIRELAAISDAVNSNRMPKSSVPLGDELKTLLANWIAAGAPEVGDQAPIVLPAPVLEPIWKSISENIIVPRCLICHNPEGQAKFLDLSSRQAIFTARDRIFGAGEGKKLIDFENPDSSYLLNVIQDPIEPMPPVSSNIRRLNIEEIKALRDWIELGLP